MRGGGKKWKSAEHILYVGACKRHQPHCFVELPTSKALFSVTLVPWWLCYCHFVWVCVWIKKNSKLIVIWVFFFFFYICCFYLDDSHVKTRLPWQLLSDVPGGLRCGRKSRFQGLQLLGFYSGPRPASFSDGALLVVLVAARVFIR